MGESGMTYHYWDLIPLFKMPNLIGVDSVYHRNCKRIEEQLCKFNIKANVSRHKLFGVELFLLDVSDNDRVISKSDIVESLNIPNDYVNLYQCTDELDEYAILEKELIQMYGDCHKELHFKEEFKFLDKIGSNYAIYKQLRNNFCKDFNIVNMSDEGIIFLKDYHSADFIVAEKLNIPKDAVIDISTHSDEYSHIILVDRCK